MLSANSFFDSIKRNIVAACLLCAVASGCSNSGNWFLNEQTTEKKTDDKDANPTLKHAPASEVWEVLAQYVEAEVITTPSVLAEYVKALLDNQDLATGDVAKFDTAFKNAPTDQRKLTKDDAKTLRGL